MWTGPGSGCSSRRAAAHALIFVDGVDPELTDAALRDEVESAIAECEARRALLEAFARRAEEIIGYLRRDRLPDDRPEASDMREWILNFAGLSVGEVLQIGRRSPGGNQDPQFVPLARFTPDARGRVMLRFWEQSGRSPGELAVLLESNGNPRRGPEAQAFIGCSRFERAAELKLDGEHRHHALVRTTTDVLLACVTTRGLWVYSVADPSAPGLVAVSPTAGLRKVTRSRAGLLVWGDDGVWQIGRLGELRRVLEIPARDILEHRGALVVVTEREVRVVEPGTAADLPLLRERAVRWSLQSDHLSVDSDHGRYAFDLTRPLEPRRVRAPGLLERLWRLLLRIFGAGDRLPTAGRSGPEAAPEIEDPALAADRLDNVAVTLGASGRALEVHRFVRFDSN